jgi:hypothetical protein
MSFGQEFAAGIRAGQGLFEPFLKKKRQKDQLAQQMTLQKLRNAADLEQMKAKAGVEREGNLQANQAAIEFLKAQGMQLPETLNPDQLQYLTPQQLNAAADDWSRRNKEKGDLERKQKGAAALYKALPESLKQSITAEDVVNLDPALLNGLMNQELNRSQRDASREDNQSFRQQLFSQGFENQKALRQIALENQKTLKSYAQSLKPPEKSKRSGSGGKTLRRYNSDTDSYDLYDVRTGQKLGQAAPSAKAQSQKDLYAPIQVNYTPRR